MEEQDRVRVKYRAPEIRAPADGAPNAAGFV
jgi:hypothetical protein